MALVGFVRVSTSKQETQRQHDDLDPICVKVFEEKVSGKLRVADRPGLRAALDYLRPGDLLTVQEADRLGRNLLEGLIVLNDLFQQGISVKVLKGIAAGEHTERNLILDLALALAEDRRRDIVRKTRDGLDAARRQGRVGGRPRVVDDDKRRAILARRAEGQSLREIARGVGVSLAVVHGEVRAAEVEDQAVAELPPDTRPVPDLAVYDELLTRTPPAPTSTAVVREHEPGVAVAQSKSRRQRWTRPDVPVRELVTLTRDKGTGDYRVHDGQDYLGRITRQPTAGGRGRWQALDTHNTVLSAGPFKTVDDALTRMLSHHLDRESANS